jgi:hypothetical protein
MSFPANTIGLAAEAAAPRQEAVMGHAIPRQQPAVVLRSHFDNLRALLAVALVAIVGLTAAVVILASDSDEVSSTSAAKSVESTRGPLPAQLPNTGYEPGTRGPLPAQLPNSGYEPGTRGPLPAQLPNTGYEPGIESVNDRDFSPATGRPEWLLPKWTPEEGTSSAREQDLRHLRAGGVIPTRAREANGDWAHGPLPPDAPAKDYSKNAATGD